MSEWINSAEMLPPTEHKVLAYNKRDGMFIAEIKEYPLAFLWTDQKYSYRIVEYWRELPDPPKEGDRE